MLACVCGTEQIRGESHTTTSNTTTLYDSSSTRTHCLQYYIVGIVLVCNIVVVCQMLWNFL